ncbi:COP9 signalosome-like protein complex subunit 12 [Amylocarpus encephaloides]|uniref:COP9 signalosome-like protein complex subunit 12 n=1 Tax=Amylocarpus encephaloides TaxID=45428 RepID=A0A9P7YSM0_9HELO|nr:COP9 signalosome-like protein complex subunit 12 [Amylocarpus encephaloides]
MAIVDEFLASISSFLRKKDAEQLRLYLRVEPPLPDHFMQLSKELKQSYRDNNRLERQIEKFIPEHGDFASEEGDAWPGFLAFIKEYLEFWRDVDFDNLLATHAQLTTLVNTSITALSNPSYGIVVLPTAIQLSSNLAKLGMMLDKRPDLTSRLRKVADAGGEGRKTLVEGTAETIQRAFTMCLTDRSHSAGSKPGGRKVGIYSFANMVLKLLFQCRKTQLATQMFQNITQHSPQLSLYPASQRVTYLYYLGRFLFSNNHFFRAQLCLQSAYYQCHAQCINQRRHILIYLISTNLILGRFPSRAFMSRPEAKGLLEKFSPVSIAIRKGDMAAFKRALGPESENQQWFFHKGVYLPLLCRCEVLVWRSLARRVFLLTYQFPTDPNSRKAATLDILDMVTAAQFCQKILEGWGKPVDPLAVMQPGRTHMNTIFMKVPDLVPPAGGRKKLRAQQGVIFGNKMPDILEVEAIIASLVQQGLLHGFISHNQGKFAILGAKQRGGPLNAGFPDVWEVIRDRAKREGRDSEVPGWVQHEKRGGGGVVNLTGIARPVGSG